MNGDRRHTFLTDASLEASHLPVKWFYDAKCFSRNIRNVVEIIIYDIVILHHLKTQKLRNAF